MANLNNTTEVSDNTTGKFYYVFQFFTYYLQYFSNFSSNPFPQHFSIFSTNPFFRVPLTGSVPIFILPTDTPLKEVNQATENTYEKDRNLVRIHRGNKRGRRYRK